MNVAPNVASQLSGFVAVIVDIQWRPVHPVRAHSRLHMRMIRSSSMIISRENIFVGNKIFADCLYVSHTSDISELAIDRHWGHNL